MGIDVNYLALYLAIMKNLSVDKALKMLDVPSYSQEDIRAVLANQKKLKRLQDKVKILN